MRTALVLVALLACGAPDPPEARMPLVTVPLTTMVGNPLLSDVDGPWVPWVTNEDDFIRPDEFWFIQELGTPDTNQRGGYLILPEHTSASDPEGNGVQWRLRMWTLWTYSLHDTELYFRWLPPRTDFNPASAGLSAWDTFFLLWNTTVNDYHLIAHIGEDSGSSTGAHITVDLHGPPPSADFDSWTADYDPVEHRWFRVRHEESTGIMYVETASGDAPSVWTVRTSRDMTVENGLSMRHWVPEYDIRVRIADGFPSTPGWLGPWNPEPEARDLPLFTEVGDVPVAGLNGVNVPLITEIGDSPEDGLDLDE